MRRTLLALLVAGSALLAFAACQDDDTRDGEAPGRPTPGSALFDRVKTATVVLPERADRPVRITDRASSMNAQFILLGSAPARVVVDEDDSARARYPGAAPGGGDLTLVVSPDGVEDYITLHRAPDEPIAYELDVSEAAGVRHVGRSVELLDADGTPRLRVLPPWVKDADGRTHHAELDVTNCAFDADPRPPWGREVVDPSADSCRLVIGWPASVERYPAVLDPAWVSAASMDANRMSHTVSTVGQDHPECGDGPFVVVVGGFRLDNEQARRSVELYHPETGTWCQGPDLFTGRARHSATFVDTTGFDKGPNQPGGPRLVVAGGLSFLGDPSSFIANYESLDLVDWTWSGGTIWLGRADHQALAATNLDGEPRLVIVGGLWPFGRTNVTQQIDVDALIPPIAFGQPMAYVRAGHTMTRLEGAPLDRHLIVGGCSLSTDTGTGGGGGALPSEPPCEPWELYCPFTGCTDEGDDLPKLLFHAATKTGDGVIVTGGISTAFEPLPTAWRFDTGSSTWSPLPDMPTGRFAHTASPLTDGSLVVVGGEDENGDPLADARRLTADGSAWQDAGELQVARRDHGAAVLPSGAVMVMGGEGDALGTAELYIPCDSEADCPMGSYCNTTSMACSELEPDGTPCLDATPCNSGLCVDGFCCDEPCAGECEACNIVGNEGDCSELPPSAPDACLPIASCVDEVTFEDQEGNQLACTPFRCAGGECVVTCNASTQCAPGFVCNPNGDCVPPPPSSGGSCAMTGRSSDPTGAVWWWLALGVTIRSRRANRRRG